MENNKIESVPYIVHESITVKMDRTIKRLWILCLVLITLLVATNIVWVVYESQYEMVTEVSQDADTGSGNAHVIGVDNSGKN